MEQAQPKYKKYLLVCENARTDKASCAPLAMNTQLRVLLKQAIRERGYSNVIRVSRTGCLDSCDDGPNVLLMPDNIMFHHVQLSDVLQIANIAIGERAK